MTYRLKATYLELGMVAPIQFTKSHELDTANRGPFPMAAIEQRNADAIVIVEVVLEFVIMLTALIGNLLVLVSVILVRGLRTKKTNLIYVLALAMADLLVSIFVMPFHIIQEWLDYWPLGNLACRFFISNDIFFCTASLLGIACIAIERYIAVFKPFRYETLITTKNSVGIVGIAWVVSFLLSYVPVQLHAHEYKHDDVVEGIGQRSRCTLQMNPFYALFSSAISFWIPACLICFVYLRIYFGAKRQLDELCMAAPMLVPHLWPFPVERANSISSDNPKPNGSRPVGTSSSASATRSSNTNFMTRLMKMHPTQRILRHQVRGTTLRTRLLLGRIVGCFVVCWSPFFLMVLLDSLGFLEWALPANTRNTIMKAAVWLGYINSAANPFIYAMSNHEIAQFWKKIRSRLRFSIAGATPSAPTANEKQQQRPTPTSMPVSV